MFRRKVLNTSHLFTLTLWVITATHSYSQSLAGGVREMGMAGSGVSTCQNWTIFENPATLTVSDRYRIGAAYSNFYGLKELGTSTLSAHLPLGQKGVFGASYQYFGTKLFNQQYTAVAYGMDFGENLRAGVQGVYISNYLPGEYETARTIAGALGLLARPFEKFNIGLHIFNLTASNFTDYYAEPLPVFARVGAQWQENNFLLTTQVHIQSDATSVYSLGTEISLIEQLKVRVGVSNGRNMNYALGLGYRLKTIEIDIAFTQHQQLGMSSHIGLLYILPNSK